MFKKVALIIPLMVFLCFASLFSAAAENAAEADENDIKEYYVQQYRASGAEALENKLPDETKSLLESLEIDISSPYVKEIDTKNVFETVFSQIAEHALAPFTACLAAVSFILIASLFFSVCPEDAGDGIPGYITALILAALIITPLFGAIENAAKTASSVGMFMCSFVPVYSGVLIAGGKAALAASYQSVVFIAAQVTSLLATSYIVPLGGMYLALCTASSVSPLEQLHSFTGAFRKTLQYALTLCMTVFTAVLAITGAVNASADTVGQRTAKFFVGSFVPVVGGVLAEALGSVQGALMLLKNAVGVFGAAAILLTVLPSIAELAAWRIMLLLCSSACEMLGAKTPVRFFSSAGNAVGLMLSLMVCIGALFLIAFAVTVSAGGAA